MSSKVWQTPMVKHRILTDETSHLIRRGPYQALPKKRAAIQERLADDIIQKNDSFRPSKSPLASPVVLSLTSRKMAAYDSVWATEAEQCRKERHLPAATY